MKVVGFEPAPLGNQNSWSPSDRRFPRGKKYFSFLSLEQHKKNVNKNIFKYIFSENFIFEILSNLNIILIFREAEEDVFHK